MLTSFAEGDQTTREGDRASRHHQTRTSTQRDGTHPAIGMSWILGQLEAAADKTAGSAVFTARRLCGHGTSFRPRNTIRKASSLFRSQ